MKSIVQEASNLAKAIQLGWEKAGKPAEFTVRVLEEPVKNFFGFTTRSAKVAILFGHAPEQRQRSKQVAVRQMGSNADRSSQGSSSRASHRDGSRDAAREGGGREVREQRFEGRGDRNERHERPERHDRSERSEHSVARRDRESRPFEGSREPRGRAPERAMNQGDRFAERDTERSLAGEEAPALQPEWTPAMVHFAREWMQKTLETTDRSDITFTVEPQRLHLRITLSRRLIDAHDREKQLLASLALILLQTLKGQFKTGLRGHKIVLTHSHGNSDEA